MYVKTFWGEAHFIAREEAVNVILENTDQQTSHNSVLWSQSKNVYGEAAPGRQLSRCPPVSYATEACEIRCRAG